MITSNLVFSKWDQIFKDPMTTMAAIDRVVHHSVIFDLMAMDSYRAREASDQHTPASPMIVSLPRGRTAPLLDHAARTGGANQPNPQIPIHPQRERLPPKPPIPKRDATDYGYLSPPNPSRRSL